ncbi:hypothetical protein [Ewingella americana]|jgi:hypothetical protein|uniref:Uncharacterized protein n=1 Tax=Ewingella americana TaxID=41202 RepID=A0A502G8D3_9GAMM|nr:hypothetical protein [Ewingella americana]TPG58387.1 hypothetical protein EAH77_19315 [Ewingella americana]
MPQTKRLKTSISFWQRVKHKCASAFISEPSQDSTRMMEALIPTGSLYGIEMGNIDPAWYREK